MTLYQRKSFTLPASAGHRNTCLQYGHTFADIRGNCVRCGDPRETATAPSPDPHGSEIVDPDANTEVV